MRKKRAGSANVRATPTGANGQRGRTDILALRVRCHKKCDGLTSCLLTMRGGGQGILAAVLVQETMSGETDQVGRCCLWNRGHLPMDPRIAQALATIRGDYGQCLRVSHLATQVGLSRSRFEHLFKNETGDTLKSRLRGLRLKELKHFSPITLYALRKLVPNAGTRAPHTSPTTSRNSFRSHLLNTVVAHLGNKKHVLSTD